MRVAALSVFVFMMTFFVTHTPAFATEHGSCEHIESLTGLPGDLQTVRTGGGDPSKFKDKLQRSVRFLGDRTKTAVFTREELRTMRIFLGAVREDWKLNGTSSGGRNIPGLTSTSDTVKKQLVAISVKFGCQPPQTEGEKLKLNLKHGPVSPLALLVMIVVFFGLAVVVYRLVMARQPMTRKLCHIHAVMQYDGISATTVIKDISRGGVMVEVPNETFAPEKVVLVLPDQALPATLAWTNSNFAGLKFDKTQSARMVDAIIAASEAQSKPSDINRVLNDETEIVSVSAPSDAPADIPAEKPLAEAALEKRQAGI